MPTRSIVASLLLAAFFVFPAQTQAQMPTFGGQQAQLKASPTFPEPFAEVELTLDAYSYDTTGAEIYWFIDGIEDVEARNARSLTVTVGDLGEETNVRIRVALANGQELTISKSLVPSRLDVIIEADTYTPIHYKGRALPSSGSIVRAIAIPVTDRNINDLSYTWTLDREVLYGGPVLGRTVATFQMPRSGRALLTVQVADRSGRALMQQAMYINVADVEIHFYEDNALRGLSRQAIQSPHQLIAEEMQVRAEPYFFMPEILSSDTRIEWEVNRQTVDNPSSDPLEITLRGAGGTGSFNVNTEIRNLSNLLQGAKNGFAVTF